MAAQGPGTQGTVTKTKTAYFTTEVSITLAGGQASIPVLSEGLPFASVQVQQLSGTAVTNVQPYVSNDGLNFVTLGSAITSLSNGGVVNDLWAAAGVPAKFVEFVVSGGDATSVIQINMILMGTRG